jgi:hypothetical protein
MAVAGGVCSAYVCQVYDGQLVTRATSMLRTYCATVDDALLRLGRGEAVTVAGSDMAALRRRLQAEGVLCG